MRLVSPTNGRELVADGPYSLTDGAARWPVVDGIAYLRAGRERLVADALSLLDAGDRTGALVILLADQDEWWRGPIASAGAIEALVNGAGHLSLRDAMRLLDWGPVADYFAYRWSDPVFVAGLGLVEAYWSEPSSAFELACGIGHHARALTQRGVSVAGGDVVFAKLWVARHWMVPDADLVCFDASAGWPIGSERFDLVACHDAFYFLEPKLEILERLRGLSRGCLLVSHVHNRDWPNFSAGRAVSAAELAEMFPGGVFYDDAELSRAVLEKRSPVSSPAVALDGVEAFSIAEGPALPPPRVLTGGLVLPAAGTLLRRNPLYRENGELGWPTERYRLEYGPRATFAERTVCPARASSSEAVEHWARRRELVDLPERW